MYKRLLSVLVVTLLCSGLSHAAESLSNEQKFYGKITVVDPSSKSLTVFNKKRKQEASFVWDGQTQFLKNKEAVQPSTLSVGQFLGINYIEQGDTKKATKVALRNLPGRKKVVN
jgi:hypothetical protein